MPDDVIQVVQEGAVFLQLEPVVDHGVHARLVLEGAPARVAVLNQCDEKRHPGLRLKEPEL